MSYVVDRQEAWRDTEIVAVLAFRRRAVRSRVLLRDGALRHTLTRPRTLLRALRHTQQLEGVRWRNVRPRPSQ